MARNFSLPAFAIEAMVKYGHAGLEYSADFEDDRRVCAMLFICAPSKEIVLRNWLVGNPS